MSWIITGTQQYPAVIGEPFGGGYFAGYISHTADGNPTHALIVAPRATGATGTGYPVTTNLQWKTSNTSTSNTTSLYDGAANTAAIVAAGISDHPAAQFCVELSIGGYSDWYMPARYELDIAYFNLKATTTDNSTFDTDGINPYSVPRRNSIYTLSYPAQTFVTAFKTGNSEAFANLHWTSAQLSASQGGGMSFNTGDTFEDTGGKTNSLSVRAFRRIAL